MVGEELPISFGDGLSSGAHLLIQPLEAVHEGGVVRVVVALVDGIKLDELVVHQSGVRRNESWIGPEVWIGLSSRFREAEVVPVLVGREGFVAEEEDDGFGVLVGFGEFERGLFELEAVEDDEIGVLDRTHDGRRGLISVRVHAFRDDALELNGRAADVLDDARDGRDGGHDAESSIRGVRPVIAAACGEDGGTGRREDQDEQ